ncbi:MAG TPA: ferredoxin [Candidatus Acidoferrales bacterium]|nr:ferredoxin [Candidatus Acidoferrales bacterium]
METEFKADVFFHLTGKRRGFGLDTIERLNLLPALFARYRKLEKLRYDFPLVLVREDSGDTWVQSLSELFDSMLREIAGDANGDRLIRHGLRMEREIRTLLAQDTSGSFSALWDIAASQLSNSEDLFWDSIKRLSSLRKLDGEVVDCDKATPGRLFRYAWETVQRKKAHRFRERVNRLATKLSDILRAGFARSEEGRSPQMLRASVGSGYEQSFDFETMSRLLARSGSDGLTRERSRRVQWLLSVLQSQRFFPAQSGPEWRDEGAELYSFAFENCASAVEAYRERLPNMVELTKALAIADLEIEGRYEGSRHDAFFEEFGAENLDPSEAALFPDYLVHLNAHRLSAVEAATVAEALSASLPVKVLVQTDNIVAPSPLVDGQLAFGLRSSRIASSMIGGEIYVLQSSSSALFQLRDRIYRGMENSGPALFSVFSGASENTSHVPPYLAAAAAMESRAFPTFVYDPSAGRDWASRFSLEVNPQVEADWPLHDFSYEDEAHQRVPENYAFTLVDFLGCDRRYARDFAKVPRSAWEGDFLGVPELLNNETGTIHNRIPYVLMLDENDVLQKVIVDDKLIQEARHCREMWRSLQELAGIHNSHADRLLARERKAWEEQLRHEAEARGNGQMPAGRGTAPGLSTSIASPPSPPAELKTAPPSDEAYIETSRCTSCNECINLNKKMFAYNSEKQAFIADRDAGSYRQLVEAAESCPVSIIHPGKPRNPDEPGMEELVKRAAPFL